MIKSLLTSVALVATVLTANAVETTVWEGEQVFADWSNNIIVQSSEFTGLAENDAITVYFNFDGGSSWDQLVLKTNTEGWPELDGVTWVHIVEGDSKATWTLNSTAVEQVLSSGLVIQGMGFTATKITFTSSSDIDPNLLYEGELVLSNWASGADVAPSKLKAGDVLEYTISDPGTPGTPEKNYNDASQILVKGSDWSNLLGTAKFSHASMATGTVLVGVTQEMLDNCGGKIFLQGDGGATVTKVYRHEAVFDAENVLAYGNRTLGAQVFVTIPEDAKYINVTFTELPEGKTEDDQYKYVGLCNSSWAEIAQPVNRIYKEGEPVTYQFEATPELVSTINEKKEVVFNGLGTEFLSLSVGNELVLDYDVEKLKRVESVEDVPASYATPLDIAYEELPGLGKGSQLVITYTRGTTDLDLAVYAVEEGSEPLQISGYYPPYGTGYVIIPLTEEQVVAISKGILRIEGHDMIINKIYYSEGEEITGISDITVDENAPVEYFNLQGIKISADDATNGIFIRRQGGKSVKVAR